jgi:predicted nucleotidyltransferase
VAKKCCDLCASHGVCCGKKQGMIDLKEKIRSYFSNREEVVAIYLYGSHASAKERFFSDVDVGIVLQHKFLKQAFELQSRYMADLGRQLRKDVHPVVLNNAGELLLKQVFQKGVCICINDPEQLKYFKMNRYAMIADFGYYLSMAQDGFRKAVQKKNFQT